jgi:transposase
MDSIVPPLRRSVKDKLRRSLQRCKVANVRVHYLIVLNLADGRGAYETANVLRVHNTTVYRVAKRFRQRGEWGLWDGRADNGAVKLDERFLSTLYNLVRATPTAHGWRRPTWTREMLVASMQHKTGVRIHVATMSRALKLLGARRGRPRPLVRCPWSAAARTRRLNMIKRLLATLPHGHVAVYEDEVDIHLNPKIGPDWMVPGQQKSVMTPGQNQKRYLAGALDARSGRLHWVEGASKNSALFIALLHKLADLHPKAEVIHVILDNYRIHSSKQVQLALAALHGKVRLHFLPPYCPNDNKIERFWRDLHDNVTRNHRCQDMEHLMGEVAAYLSKRNQPTAASTQEAA